MCVVLGFSHFAVLYIVTILYCIVDKFVFYCCCIVLSVVVGLVLEQPQCSLTRLHCGAAGQLVCVVVLLLYCIVVVLSCRSFSA